MPNPYEQLQSIQWTDGNADMDIDQFHSLVDQLAKKEGPACIVKLLAIFKDEVDDHFMFAMVHTMERFPLPVYMQELLNGYEVVSAQAPDWASVLLMRIMNSASAFDQFLELLKGPGASAYPFVLKNAKFADQNYGGFDQHYQRIAALKLEERD